MVRLLVSLKLRLLRRGIRGAGTRGRVGFALAWFVSVGAGGLVGVSMAALRAVDSDVVVSDLAAIAMAVVLAMWAIGPLVVGSEGTLDPESLSLLPLDARRLMPGLLVAGGIGFGGVATALVATGLVIGTAPISPLLLVTVCGAALLMLICISTSRVVTVVLAAAIRSRRLRDISLFAGPLAGVAFSIAIQLLPRLFADREDPINTMRVPVLVRALTRVAPSGPPTMVMTSAREGRLLAALVALAASAAVLALLLRVWATLLTRVLTTAVDSGPEPTKRRQLLGGALGMLPANRFGAVVAKELRLSWRDPRQRAVVLSSMFPAVLSLLTLGALSGGSSEPSIVLLAAMPAFVLGASSTNLYGFDGPAHWTNVAAGAEQSARIDLAAKGTSKALLAVPFVVLGAIALGAITGGWDRIPLALGLACAAAGVTIGFGVVGSVRSPLPMPDTPSNPFSTGNAGQGLAAAGSGCLSIGLSALLTSPVALAAVVAQGRPVWSAIVAAGGVGVGALAWSIGLDRATRRAETHEPELLAVLDAARA